MVERSTSGRRPIDPATPGVSDASETRALVEAAAATVAMPSRQLLLDRFFLHRKLGQGGFGVVYEAEDLRDGGRVALKMLRISQGHELVRFKREFRALQGVVHPNLVTLDELFGSSEGWFFTMELVDGTDFVRYIGAAPSDLERQRRARRTFAQLLDGMAALHESGTVHRDIKPSNVLVTSAGRVVLIDFGLIHLSAGPAERAVVGTPSYMAPEQATAGNVGSSADIYSAGRMLYEALTGNTPEPTTEEPRSTSAERGAALGGERHASTHDLLTLCRRCMNRDPERRPSAREVRQWLDESDGSAPSSGRSADPGPFVGREAELDALAEAWASTEYGHSSAVIVSGPSGIGKTRLVRHFAERLTSSAGALLLEGRCHEREDIPYKALDGIVDSLAEHLRQLPAAVVASLWPHGRLRATQIFPVLSRVPLFAKGLELETREEPIEARRLAFLELRELLERLAASTPTLVFIDDLQWADEDGLQALAELLKPPDAPPILFVGTFRSGGNGDDAPDRLRCCLADRAQWLALQALPEPHARRLASLLLGGASEGVAERIVGEASGHPLFVEELCRWSRNTTGTAHMSLDDVIESRLLELRAASLAIAELVAAAGGPISQAVVLAASQLEPAEFQRGLLPLCAARLLSTTGARWTGQLDAHHDRVRAAIVRASRQQQPHLHRALAEALEHHAGADPEALATHWRAAGDLPRAGQFARAAGIRAAQALAFERAATWFEQALAWLPNDAAQAHSVRVELGNALANSGRGAQAAEQFSMAAASVDTMTALELRQRAAEQLLRSGHFDDGVEASRAVLATLGMRLPTSTIETLGALALGALRLRLRGLKIQSSPPGRRDRVDRLRIDACWSVGMALAFVDSAVGFVFQRRALLMALAAGDSERIGCLLATEAARISTAGARTAERTPRLLELARDLVDESDAHDVTILETMSGVADYNNGRFRSATAHLTRALEVSRRVRGSLSFERVIATTFLIRSWGLLGRFDELRRLRDEELRWAEARGDVYAKVNLSIGAAAQALLAADEPERAECELSHAMSRWTRRGFHQEHLTELLARVAIRLYVGDPERAYACANDAVRRGQRSLLWRIQILRFRALYTRALCAVSLMAQRHGDQRRLRLRTLRDARAIEREAMPWMQPFVRVLRAGVLPYRERRGRTLAELDLAAREFDAFELAAHAAATRACAARLDDSATARLELERILQRWRAQQVSSPERLFDTLVPHLSAAPGAPSHPPELKQDMARDAN